MPATALQNAERLALLLQTPPAERLDWLRSQGCAAEVLAALADEAERLALADVARALQATQAVVELADASGARAPRARRARAQALAYAGRHEDALLLCGEASCLADEDGDPVEAARCRLIALHPLNELGRHDEAIAIGQRARDELLALGETRLAARADFNLGGIHQNRDDPQQALLHFDRAAPAFAADPLITGYLHNNRGEALLLLNDFDGAEGAFRRALDACERAGAGVAAAIAEGNLADLAARRGRLSEALTRFEGARRRFEQNKAESHLARLLAERAEAIAALGLDADALAECQRVLPMLASLGLASEVARARLAIGQILARRSLRGEASAVLAEAAEEFERLGQPRARAQVDLLRAELALAGDDAPLAQSLLDRAAPQLAERPLDRATVGYHRAALAAQRGDDAAADAELTAALQLAQQLQVAPLLADTRCARGQIRRGQGRRAAALHDFRAAVRHVERVRGALQADRFRAAFLGNRLAAFEGLALSALESDCQEGLAEAFDAIERAKSRGLLDAVRGLEEPAVPVPEAAAAAAVTTNLRRDAERLTAELNALYCRLADATRRTRGLADEASWSAAVARLELELASVEQRLAAAWSPGAGLPVTPLALCELQSRLPASTAIVEYFVAGDELLALVIRRDDVHALRGLAAAHDLRPMIEQLRFQIARAARPGATIGPRGQRLLSDVRAELSAVDRVLIEPLDGCLDGAETIVFIPHGPLHTVPMHAPWTRGAHRIERAAVAYAPSASIFAALQRPAPDAAPRECLVVGVADEAAPQIAAEAREIAAALDAVAILDAGATREVVRDRLQSCDLAHLACHATFSREHPAASGLALADGWLTPREILALRIRARLVTLSGCSTGRQSVSSGDELAGLMRAFLSVGASSLVATLWSAHDQATYDLMRDFYRRYRCAPPEPAAILSALRASQRCALERNPHPFFWAPFVLVGNL